MKIDISDVYGILLLSEEEAEKFPEKVLVYKYGWWWLRSPGFYKYNVAVVYYDGFVDSDAIRVSNDSVNVRPALFLSHNNGDLKSGDIIEVFDRKWHYQEWETLPPKMSDGHVGLALLMDEPLTKMAFNKDSNKGNDYNNSDIKKWLNDWLEEQRDASYLKEIEESEKEADKEKVWRDEAEEILGRIGLTLDEAITIFIHQVVLRNGIPFELKK